MKIDYENKNIIITGAAGALGSAMARIFAENGGHVFILDIDEPGGKKIAKEIKQKGGMADYHYIDLKKKDTFNGVIEAITSNNLKIDVLINNAGINVPPERRNPIHEFNDSDWVDIVDVDLNSVYFFSKAVIPHINSKRGGSIVNISSVVGLVPFRDQCAFAAAKAGVINLSKAMALELADMNIRVNVIAPGSIETDLTKGLIYKDPIKTEAMLSHIPLHRPGRPDEIAYAALYLSSEDAGYVTGSVLTVDGGWTCGFARDF